MRSGRYRRAAGGTFGGSATIDTDHPVATAITQEKADMPSLAIIDDPL
jgi:hypothetical protein